MSNLRDYDVTVVMHPDMDEENRNKFLEAFSDVLTHAEGEENKPQLDFWGKRTLAYEIKKVNEGYYAFFDAKLDGTKIRDMERDLNYNESILRYLFVRKEEEK